MMVLAVFHSVAAMGMRLEEHTVVVPLPRDFSSIPDICGIDIGCSLIKVARRSTSEHKGIVLEAYPLNCLQELLTSLRAREGQTPGCRYHITGYGSFKEDDKLQITLSASSFRRYPEMSCCLYGLHFLTKNYIMDDFIYHIPEDIQTAAYEQDKTFEGFRTSLTESGHDRATVDQEIPIANSNGIHFPCLLIVCGSTASIYQVNGDDSFKLLGHEVVAGKCFMNLGHLLTGCEDFSELMDLARRGDVLNVDTCAKHLDGYHQEKWYQAIPPKARIFAFGQANSLHGMRKEDSALGLLQIVTESLAKAAHYWATLMNLKQVIFAGTFPTSDEFTRHLLARFCQEMNALKEANGKLPIEPIFLKHGTYLAALGAMLQSTPK